MRIVIVGAGKTGVFLAQRLSDNHRVSVLETRADRVGLLRSMMPELAVYEGDACEPSFLDYANLEGADLLVAATGDDEDNLVISMLAKVYHVGTVFARVNHPSNEWLFTTEWGVDVAVSAAAIMYGLVEKQIGLGDLITLLRLQADNVSIDEFTLPVSSQAVGKRLADVSLPSTTQVMAIIAKSGGITIARGDTVLNAGDQLLLLSEGECSDEVCTALGMIRPDAPS